MEGGRGKKPLPSTGSRPWVTALLCPPTAACGPEIAAARSAAPRSEQGGGGRPSLGVFLLHISIKTELQPPRTRWEGSLLLAAPPPLPEPQQWGDRDGAGQSGAETSDGLSACYGPGLGRADCSVGVSPQAWAEFRAQSPEASGVEIHGLGGWGVLTLPGPGLRARGLSPSVSPRPLSGSSVTGRGSEEACQGLL